MCQSYLIQKFNIAVYYIYPTMLWLIVHQMLNKNKMLFAILAVNNGT